MDLVLGGGAVVLLFIAHVNSQESWISAPQNAAGGDTDKVTLKCHVHEPFGIKWSKITTNEDMPSIISTNTTIDRKSNPIFYSIENPNRYQYNLVIELENRFDSGGRYMCEELGSTRKGLAHVIQLLPTALCHSSLGADRVVVEGESISLTCFVNYTTSPIDWPPSITWTGPDGIISDVIDESIPGHVKVSLQLVGSARLNEARFIALTHFLLYNGTFPEHHANNTPSYSKTTIFDPLIVHYQPQSVTFDPEKVSYVSGDLITCSSEGNPTVSYRWYDITDNTTVSAGAMVNITNTMVGDVTLACEAYNVIRGNVMAISRQIYISTSTISNASDVETTETSPSRGIASTSAVKSADAEKGTNLGMYVGIGVGALVVTVVAAAGAILYCRTKNTSNKKKDNHQVSRSNEYNEEALIEMSVVTPPEVDINTSTDILVASSLKYPETGEALRESQENEPEMMSGQIEETNNISDYGRQPPPPTFHLATPSNDHPCSNDPRENDMEGVVYADIALHPNQHGSKPNPAFEATEYAEIMGNK